MLKLKLRGMRIVLVLPMALFQFGNYPAFAGEANIPISRQEFLKIKASESAKSWTYRPIEEYLFHQNLNLDVKGVFYFKKESKHPLFVHEFAKSETWSDSEFEAWCRRTSNNKVKLNLVKKARLELTNSNLSAGYYREFSFVLNQTKEQIGFFTYRKGNSVFVFEYMARPSAFRRDFADVLSFIKSTNGELK